MLKVQTLVKACFAVVVGFAPCALANVSAGDRADKILSDEDQQTETDVRFCNLGGGFYDPASGVCFGFRGGSNPS